MTFPCYPDYKDSGVEWLGDVPVGWGLSRVKFDSYVKARVGWHGLKSDEFTDEGPYLVTGSDFKNKTVDWRNCYHCTDERFEQDEFIQLKENDLLITKDGTIGKLILVENLPGKATLNSGIFVVRPLHEKYSTRFYFWLLQSSVFFDFVGVNKTGSTIVHLYQETFENLPYTLPPLAEQLQIARFLDHETARIDALIEEQKRLIELLKEKRLAVISRAVTKGLDPTVPMKDSGVEWLGEVPAHWVCKSYRYASIIYRGKFSHRPRNDPSLYDGDFAFIQTGDIARAEKYIVEYKQTLNEKGVSVSQKFPSGTLVMAIAANVGDTAILGFEAYAPDSVVGFKPERDIELEFLRFSLMAALQELKKTSTQSTQANLNIDRISGIKSVFPPLAEQSAITVYLNEVMERFSLLEKQTEASIELMNERRSALISAAVTGKIDVRGWQPPVSTQAPKFEVAEAV